MRTAPIRTIGTRVNLVFGGDRVVVLSAAVLAAGTILSFDPWVIGMALCIWLVVLAVARRAAREDPRYFQVLWRYVTYYQRYYPARPTPYRKQTLPPRWCK